MNGIASGYKDKRKRGTSWARTMVVMAHQANGEWIERSGERKIQTSKRNDGWSFSCGSCNRHHNVMRDKIEGVTKCSALVGLGWVESVCIKFGWKSTTTTNIPSLRVKCKLHLTMTMIVMVCVCACPNFVLFKYDTPINLSPSQSAFEVRETEATNSKQLQISSRSRMRNGILRCVQNVIA